MEEESMSTATAEPVADVAKPNGKPAVQLPAIQPPRLPFHPAIEERFGVGKAEWKALVEAVFPLATSIDSVILVLSYCKARKLDPFKRNVHIVPIWNKQLNRMVDTVWPGIGELRTTAFRTGQYAGRGETVFGPDVTKKVGAIEITFPEWAQVTVQRIVNGQLVGFTGPRVYWLETYSQAGRNDTSPNSMWARRTRGQLEKCAEAASLRAAFPEEIGNEFTNDEAGQMQYDQAISTTATTKPIDDARSASDKLADMLETKTTGNAGATETVEQTTDELELVSEGDAGGAESAETSTDQQSSESSTQEPEIQSGQFLARDDEKSPDYLQRLLKAITETQSPVVLDAIGNDSQTHYDRFGKNGFKAVTEGIEKRRQELVSAQQSGELIS